jgi:hypothetical protein
VSSKAWEVQKMAPHLLEVMRPTLHDRLKMDLPIHIENIKQNLIDKIGVLCLSEVNDSILMWSHYASNHEGFVVEFDVHNPFFSQNKFQDNLGFLREAIYLDKRPRSSLRDANIDDFYFSKSKIWSYENECRMLLPLDEANKDIEDDLGRHIHLFLIPVESITGVIFGVRSSDDVKGRVEEYLQKRNLDHIKIKQAEMDDDNYLINIVDVVA